MEHLVSRRRLAMGRSGKPRYATIDSQSVKTSGASKERGVDERKNVKGRKRHIVTDAQGHLLYILVHRAHIHDTIASKAILKANYRKIPVYRRYIGCCWL